MPAADIYDAIKKNAEAYCDDRIDYDAFCEVNRGLWDVAENSHVTDEVRALWRNDNPL